MTEQPEYRIIDDFLDEASWTEVWSELQFAPLDPVSKTHGAWKLDDGTALGGELIVTPPRDQELAHDPEKPHVFPSQTALDHVLAGILEHAAEFASIVGDAWAHITARSYVYPAGSALSWHGDDHARYSGAFVYYAHPYWNAHWGGELLLAETNAVDMPIMGHRFDNEDYSRLLLERGEGRFVMPKPNRLLVLGAAPHMIAPVRPAAGQSVRASVSGFFVKGQVSGPH